MNTEVEVSLSDEDAHLLIKIFLENHLSKGSLSVFNEKASFDMTSVFEAAGQAILNEAVVNSIKLKLEEEKQSESEPRGD